jgi:16S rRNA (adenine1518-N6/adenine1519-N6)-dimethyltransferase
VTIPAPGPGDDGTGPHAPVTPPTAPDPQSAGRPPAQGLRQRVVADLAAAGLAPLHRLGQNFMVDGGALDALVQAAGVTAGARVAEIGPGTGHLTERLLAAGATVFAIELDRGLAAFLARTLVPRGLTLVHGDGLAGKSRLHPALEAFAREPWRLCANLPYDAALPIILESVAQPRPPDALAVTVQREAAVRLCSRPGSAEWGASAAVFQAAGKPRIVRVLGPGSFHPRPRVDSAILAWAPGAVPLPPGFGAWCRRLFSARRKVLPGALRDAGMTRPDAEAACRACSLEVTRRLEQLDADELLALRRACGDPPEPAHAPS